MTFVYTALKGIGRVYFKALKCTQVKRTMFHYLMRLEI